MLQAHNQRGCTGCVCNPPSPFTGPKGPHFDTQCPGQGVQSVKLKDTSKSLKLITSDSKQNQTGEISLMYMYSLANLNQLHSSSRSHSEHFNGRKDVRAHLNG